MNRIGLTPHITFHSPRVKNPTEIEIGDVVVWVRTQLIVFEIISREPGASSNLSSFTRRIGEKRDQLVQDFKFFDSLEHDISLVNEDETEILFLNEYFVPQGFMGLVIVDIGSEELTLHKGTVEKCLLNDFPTNIIHYSGLQKVIHELDTVSDVYFYFLDRYRFLPFLFKNHTGLVVKLTESFESNLLGFYKMNENSFPEEKFNLESFPTYWETYQTDFSQQIANRDIENDDSYVIDRIIGFILDARTPDNDETIFAWELATLARRQRAGYLTETVVDALARLQEGNEKRFFAYFNDYTKCWILFLFVYGDSTDSFRGELDRLLRLKTIYEAVMNDFGYSTFGYGFRKSELITQNPLFDEMAFDIQDVETLEAVSAKEIAEAKTLFGHKRSIDIKEFPVE